MRALAGYLEILLCPPEADRENPTTIVGDVLSRDVFLNVLDIVIESLKSDTDKVRYEGYKALSKLAKVPKHHTRIVASAGHFLINSSIKSSELRDTAKFIDQTLIELGFDPSSDVKICQYDPSMFEQWFMIKKRLRVQDRVENSIKQILEDLWKDKKIFCQTSSTDIETKEKQVETAKNLSLDAKNLTSGSVDVFSISNDNDKSKDSSTSSIDTTPGSKNQSTAETILTSAVRADSLIDIVFGFNVQDLRKRSRSSTVPSTKGWSDYIKSNPAHDGSTLVPGLDAKSLIEFVGYYPSLLQRRLLLFAPDRGPLDELPQIRTLVMPNHEYYTFKYGAILEKIIERNYDLADVWSILFTSCQFENDTFVKNFCEALYRLPTVYFLTFFNEPTKRKSQEGSQIVSLISNLPPFIGWITFDNALSAKDLKDIMIPLARSNVSGLAIRNSNFTLSNLQPFLNVLKHNSSLKKRLTTAGKSLNNPQESPLPEINVQIGKHSISMDNVHVATPSHEKSWRAMRQPKSGATHKISPGSPTDPLMRRRRSKRGKSNITLFTKSDYRRRQRRRCYSNSLNTNNDSK